MPKAKRVVRDKYKLGAFLMKSGLSLYRVSVLMPRLIAELDKAGYEFYLIKKDKL